MPTFESSNMHCAVVQRFEYIAQTCADHPAIHTALGMWTYAELNQYANQIAHGLLRQTGTSSSPAAILCGNMRWQLAAILAAIKTGRAVVMLDVALPNDRLMLILDNSQAEAILFDSALAQRAEEICGFRPGMSISLVSVDTDLHVLPATNPGIVVSITAPLSIIYTSGSIGYAKGVQRNHDTQMQSVWANYGALQLRGTQRAAIISSLAYAATWGLGMGMLLYGGCLCVYDLSSRGLTPFSQWLTEMQVTIVMPPIALLRQWYNNLPTPIQLPHLQTITLVGATINKADLVQLREKVQGSYTIRTVYGLTETLFTSQNNITDPNTLPDDDLPAGYDASNKQILILDENHTELGVGQVGEIVVQSRYISQYWRLPALNQSKFAAVPNDPTQKQFFTGDLGYKDAQGCLYLAGRKDFMVKIRGYQVDLNELESVLLQLPDVLMAAAVASDMPAAGALGGVPEKILLAYLVLKPNITRNTSQIRKLLISRLSTHMLPSHIIIVDQLPVLPNGKIDRQALAKRAVPDRRLPDNYVAPRNPLETQLADIWAEVLAINPIGIHEAFLEIGGNSLQAMQIIGRVLRQLQTEVSVHALMASASIESMALTITQTQARKLDPATLDKILAELEHPSK